MACNNHQKKGFTLLMAIITTSMLLIVSFMVVNIAVKQLVISNTNQESQYAFYSSDSGIECATYWDLRSGANPFDPSTPSNISCNGSSISPIRTSYVSGISTSTFTVPLTVGCVDVEIIKNQNTSVTTVNSRGYNNCVSGTLRRFQRGVTITYPSNPLYVMDVTWQNVGGVTASGNNLTSTAAAWGGGGASSVQNIQSGDGYVEFSTNENNLAKAGALTRNTDPDKNYTSLNYAIILNNSGGAAVYENGTGSVVNTYVAGDVFKIEIKNGIVNYYKNGVILCGTSVCSHSTTPTYPLNFDSSFNAVGATITGVRIGL